MICILVKAEARSIFPKVPEHERFILVHSLPLKQAYDKVFALPIADPESKPTNAIRLPEKTWIPLRSHCGADVNDLVRVTDCQNVPTIRAKIVAASRKRQGRFGEMYLSVA
jgi:hypothetical protein